MEKCLLEGIISVKAAIDGNSRDIEKIYIDLGKRKQRDRKVMGFISYLKEKGIDFELRERAEIDELAKCFYAGSTHGGVVAVAGKRSFDSLEEMLGSAQDGDYFVYLDGVEDPFNFGYSVRTLYAMGASGFIVPERNLASLSGAAVRASAGATELCRMCKAYDDEKTAKLIKEKGIHIVCSALSHDSVSLYEFQPDKPFVLFIGGEKRGISKDFMDNADRIVHIPYSVENARYSLPTVSVCSLYAGRFAEYAKRRDSDISE